DVAVVAREQFALAVEHRAPVYVLANPARAAAHHEGGRLDERRSLWCLDAHARLAPVRERLVASHPAEGILSPVLAVPTRGPTRAARRVELRARGTLVVDRAADIRIPGRGVQPGPGAVSRECLPHVVGQRYPQCVE